MVALTLILTLLCTTLSIAQSGETLHTTLERMERLNATITNLRSEYSTVESERQREEIAQRIMNLENERIGVAQRITQLQGELAEYRVASKKPSSVTATPIKADSEVAHRLDSLYGEQLERLIELSNLRNRYNQSSSESEALAVRGEFDSLKRVVAAQSEELARVWGGHYDDTYYQISLMIEQLDDGDLRRESQRLTMESSAAIAQMGSVEDEAIVRYEYQRRELLGIELLLARKLSLKRSVDSLSRVSKELSAKGVEGKFTPVEIVERLFIDYSPLSFSSATSYSNSNPIPATKIHKRGVVYRILYGGFTSQQSPSIFRGTKPLSVNREGKLYRYYGGGFKRYSEAVAAQKISKERGFNRPEVVMWRDGVSRNLSRQPYAKGSYRVVVTTSEELSDEVVALVKRSNPDAQITRIGASQYVISPFAERMVAEDMAADMDEYYDIDRVEIVQ